MCTFLSTETVTAYTPPHQFFSTKYIFKIRILFFLMSCSLAGENQQTSSEDGEGVGVCTTGW